MAYTKEDMRKYRDGVKTKERDDSSSSLSSDSAYSVDRMREMRDALITPRKNVYDDYAQMATQAATPATTLETSTEPTYRYDSIDKYDQDLASSPLNKKGSKEWWGYTGKKAANAGINILNHAANLGNYLTPSSYMEWMVNGKFPEANQISNVDYSPEERAYEDLKTERNLYATEHIFDEKFKPMQSNADYQQKANSITDDEVAKYLRQVDNASKNTYNNSFVFENMSPEEREMARYIMATNKGGLVNYMQSMEAHVARPVYEQTLENINQFSDKGLLGKTAVSAGTVATNMLTGLSPLEIAADEAAGFVPNVYGGTAGLGNLSNEARSNIAEDLEGKYGHVASMGYLTGMSMADSYVGGKVLYGKAYAPIMSGNVYNNTYKEMLESGADREDAMVGALLAGGAEWAFETISLENLLKPKNPATFKQLLMEYAKQSGIEASEEYFTELANIMSEELVQGTHSDIQRMITKMRNDGKSEDEIKAEISKYVTRRVGEAALGGLISGGGLSMLSNTAYYANNVDVGKRTNRETLSDVISTLDENSETYKKYNGQDLSKLKNSEIGAIVSEVYEEASKFDNETYHNALVNALEAEGFNEDDAAEYADALTADKPSPLQKLMLKDNEIVRRVKQTVDETVKAELDATSKLRAIAVENAVTSKEQADHKKRADKIFAKIKTGDINKVNEEPAEILGIEKKNGRYVVRTDKGNVNLSDISVTENTARALAYAMDYDNPDFQAAFIRNYNGQNMDEYEVYAYNVFMSGQQYDSDILSNANLDEALGGHEAVSDFLESGRMSSESSSQNAREIERAVEEAVNAFSGEIKPVKGRFTSKVNPKSLKPTKQGIYAVLKGMAEAGGIPTEVIYDTETSDNGIYRRSDGVIVINLAAKEYINSSGYRSTFVLPAYAHELTHWMRPNASDSYDALSNAVFKYLAMEGINIDDEVAKKIKEYADANVELDDEDAKEEIVAQACENMLNDTKVMEKILEKMTAKEITGFKATLQKFFKAIKDFINKLGSKSTNDYVKALDKYYDELADLWAEGIATAMVRQQIINGNAAIDAGVQIDESTHTVAHSVRTTIANTYEQLGYSKYEDALEFMASSIANQMYEESKWNSDEWLKAKDDAMKWIQAEESVSAFILQSVETKKWLDYDADERFKAIKGDTDYPQGTLDLSNRCRKREVFTKIFDNLQTANPNMLFTAEDIAAIRDTLEEAKVETACALCYVEDRRQHLGVIANDFIGAYKEALNSKNKVIMYKNSSGKVTELNATKDEQKAYGVDLYKATDKYVPTQADLITYEGFKNLEKNHPDIAHAFERWNKKRGQASGRLIEGHAEYKRELLKWTSAQIKKANDLGGFRIFSFSDLEGIHVIDVMQAIIDASVMGIKIQAYTKVPAFAKIVKDTGIKVNLSLIPANVDSKNAYAYVNNKWVKVSNKMVENGIAEVDGKEYLAVDIKEGIDVTSKDFDMYRDNPNIGLEITGISDKQMKLAMADPNIDYIIPFHSNQSTEVLKIKKIDTWHNYKLEQTDTGGDINIYTDVIEKYNVKTKDEFIEAFKKEIEAQKKTARFNRFIEEDGYYKTLLDYKLFDANGNILLQENVVPRFDEDTLKFVNGFLAEDMERSKNMKLSDDVMNKIYDTLEKRGKKVNPISDAKHSLQRADRVLGKNSKVPTKEEVVSGNATYGGLPIVYKPDMHAEAENYTTAIWVSDKLFNYSEEIQRHILNHEVAHNLSDDMQREHLANWQEFASIFVQEKKVPESSQAYKSGKRTYWEGLYGDMHATAINETTTRAITEYLDDPERLKQRSQRAYDTVDEFMKRNGYIEGDVMYSLQKMSLDELLFDDLLLDDLDASDFFDDKEQYINDLTNLVDRVEDDARKVEYEARTLGDDLIRKEEELKRSAREAADLAYKDYAERFTKDGKRIALKDSTIDEILSDDGRNTKAKEYIAYMSPYEFLKLTSGIGFRSFEHVADWTRGDSYNGKDFDIEVLKEKYAKYGYGRMYLVVDFYNGHVVGHEGRHRMWQLNLLGYDKIPVILESDSRTYLEREVLKKIKLTAQAWSIDDEMMLGESDTITVTNLIPVSNTYADELKSTFGENASADTYFSKQRKGLDVNSKRLEKENKLLKSDIDALQEFIKINKRLSDAKEWNPLKTEAVTKNIIEKYKSDIDPKSLRQMLSRLYTYMTETLSSDSADTSMDAIMNECYAVAAEVYKDIKKKPTITKTQILDELKKANVEGKADSELIEQIKDAVALANEEDYIRKLGVDIYNGYWKMATLKTQADINKAKIEQAKSEQAKLKANAKEQVENQKLADAMHYGREIAENKRASREALTKEKQRRIRELREAHKKTLEELDKQKLADSMHYGRLLEKARQDRDNKIKEAKQHMKDTEAKRKENAEKRNLIKKITKVSTDLLERIAHPDKKNIVPAPMVEPLRNLCRAIDYSSQQLLGIRQGKNAYTPTRADYRMGDLINEVSEVLSRMKSQAADGNDSFDLAGLTIAPEYGDELLAIGNRLNKTKEIIESGKEFTLQLMSVEDLKVLANVLTDIKTNINNLNRIISSSNAHEVDYIGRAWMNHMISLGEKDVPKLLKFPLKYMTIMNKTPYYFFKHMGEGGQEMFELFMSGWDKYSFNSLKILEETQKLYKPEDVTKWDETIHTFEITLPLTIGEIAEGKQARRRTIQMSESQIMSLYCMAKREQARVHILDGNGIVVDEIKRKGFKNDIEKQKATIISEADLNRIIKVVENDAKMKKVADGIQEFMNTTCSQWINEVYYKLHGTLLATEKSYFPISVDQDTMATQAKEKHDSLYGLINQNWAKPLMPNSKNQVLVSNIFDVFVDHALSTAKYNALALPVLDMIKVWNYSEANAIGEEGKEEINNVKIAIRHAIGAEGNAYISHLLHDINGDSESGRYDDLWMRFIKRSKIAKVGANATTALLQPLSYERAAYVMDTKYLAAALKQKPQVEKCFKNIGVAAWKHMGFYDTNMTASLSRIIRNTETIADKAVSASLLPAELMDELTWGYLYNAVELECKDRYKNLTPQALDAMVAKRLREVLYATQVFDSTLSRTDMMRSPSTNVKLWTAFGSEPILHINMLMDALTEFTYERKMHGTKVAKRKYGAQLARAGVVYLVASIVESALREAMSRWKKYDDEDDKFFDGFLVALLKRTLEELNPLNKIPIVKDVISVIKSALNGWSQRTDMDMEWVSSIVDAYGSMIKAVQNGEMSFKTFQKIVDAVSLTTGIPIGNAVKELKSVWNNLVGRFTGWYLK